MKKKKNTKTTAMFRYDIEVLKKRKNYVSGTCTVVMCEMDLHHRRKDMNYPKVAEFTFEREPGVFGITTVKWGKKFDRKEELHRFLDIYTGALLGKKFIWGDIK